MKKKLYIKPTMSTYQIFDKIMLGSLSAPSVFEDLKNETEDPAENNDDSVW